MTLTATVEVNWFQGYGNNPEFIVNTPDRPAHQDFVYEVIHHAEGEFLLSTNLDPWVKFVYVTDRDGQPQYHGALGGAYKLVPTPLDPEPIYRTRTGWSSRAGVINCYFYPEYLRKRIVDVALNDTSPKGFKWAGYAVYIDWLEELVGNYNDTHEEYIYIVKQTKPDGEVCYYPSIHPHQVRKPA